MTTPFWSRLPKARRQDRQVILKDANVKKHADRVHFKHSLVVPWLLLKLKFSYLCVYMQRNGKRSLLARGAMADALVCMPRIQTYHAAPHIIMNA
jgi:hypothetical protein